MIGKKSNHSNAILMQSNMSDITANKNSNIVGINCINDDSNKNSNKNQNEKEIKMKMKMITSLTTILH